MASINCDLGEGYGRYRLADDDKILQVIDLANIACGFHASDPMIMDETVHSASRLGVKIGAHPSFPDLQGFGRREMRLSDREITTMVRYQVGALSSFAERHGASLHHVKPHGALYMQAAREERIAHAICDALDPATVKLLGLGATAHEHVYLKRGFEFVPEFYVDLDYDDDGSLIAGGQPHLRDPAQAAERAITALTQGVVTTLNGRTLPVKAESICVHSDSGNALMTVTAIRNSLQQAGLLS